MEGVFFFEKHEKKYRLFQKNFEQKQKKYILSIKVQSLGYFIIFADLDLFFLYSKVC